MKIIQINRTATHIFQLVADRYQDGTFTVEFRPLNPKTGKAWQAAHRVKHGADIEPKGFAGRPIAYSTVEKALAAMAWKQGR